MQPSHPHPSIAIYLLELPVASAGSFSQHAAQQLVPLLGRTTGLALDRLQWEKDAHGKPQFVDRGLRRRLSFNYAHTTGALLLAVAGGGPVGVDIEAVRDIPEREIIAADHFHPDEHALLASSPPGGRPQAFLRLWVRKEAFIKAVGLGLKMNLRTFSVAASDDHVFLVSQPRRPRGAPADWWVTDLALPSPFIGAVCTDRPDPTIELHQEMAAPVASQSPA